MSVGHDTTQHDTTQHLARMLLLHFFVAVSETWNSSFIGSKEIALIFFQQKNVYWSFFSCTQSNDGSAVLAQQQHSSADFFTLGYEEEKTEHVESNSGLQRYKPRPPQPAFCF